MGEDAWYFGGDELMLVSTEDAIYGYDEMMSVIMTMMMTNNVIIIVTINGKEEPSKPKLAGYIFYFKPLVFLYFSTILLLASINTLLPNITGYIDGILRADIEIGVINALTSSSGLSSLHGSRPSGMI